MDELNVKKIMEEIRIEIKEKGYTNEMLSFSDVTADDTEVDIEKFDRVRFNEELFNINMLWNIDPNRAIEDKPGLRGKCITLFKKLIRKCIRFYLASIVTEQDTFNATSVRLFNLLNLYMEENTKLSEEVNSLKNEQTVLKNRINQLYDLHYRK